MYTLFKIVLHALLRLIYRVEIQGLEHYHQAGKRVLIVSNHISLLDPLLLGVFLPDKITFAINTQISQIWWIKPFLWLSNVFPMDPTNPLSLKALIQNLKTDTKTVIFPEGRITTTGALMKIYDGTGMVVDKSGATILPVRISGAEYTHFSKMKGIHRLRLFPKITIQIRPPIVLEIPATIQGKARRNISGQELANIMQDTAFLTSDYQKTIFAQLLQARTNYGGKHQIVEDLERKPLTYDNLITRVLILSKLLNNITASNAHVGVLLPNSTTTLNVILGLQFSERVPAMLNFSTGVAGMIAACQTAKINTVISSRKFIDLGKLTAEAEALSKVVKLVYLEDLAAGIKFSDKIKAIIASKTANFWYPNQAQNSNNAAVILFTSGSEGTPKGVVLSHSNICANINQVKSSISFNSQDVVLNFLPMFHSFGFTAGTFLPLLNGMNTFFYPSPLHYSVIPELAYETKATIMFGTNTFLLAYAKKAHAYDFQSLRYVIAGAEKLQASTRNIWSEKFGIRVLEGYGATETSPVTSVNTPMNYKAGSVGRLLPLMEAKLESIAGIEQGGQLHLKGPNIMQGYLLADNPGQLVPAKSRYGAGWYDTGDIVTIDSEGFIEITGRSKRFAKIAGEMVSLAVVEQLASQAWPETQHAAVADARKGEQIILLTTQKQATLAQISQVAIGVAIINLPRKIFTVDAIPILATGKINYPQVNVLAVEMLR